MSSKPFCSCGKPAKDHLETTDGSFRPMCCDCILAVETFTVLSGKKFVPPPAPKVGDQLELIGVK